MPEKNDDFVTFPDEMIMPHFSAILYDENRNVGKMWMSKWKKCYF